MTQIPNDCLAEVLPELEAMQEWLRKPDWDEKFGTREITNWMNDRPCHVIPRTVRILKALYTAHDNAPKRLAETKVRLRLHEAADHLQGIVEREHARLLDEQWQLIGEDPPYKPVLVSRPRDKVIYTPTTAFYDATGIWRVFRSKGGMQLLPFEPTHWMPLPPVPSQVTA